VFWFIMALFGAALLFAPLLALVTGLRRPQ
jgi:hypothetical protein